MHIPQERRNKLDSKSEKCIFVEYKDGIKGYKLWNPTTSTVVYNRDVIFKEDESTSKNEEVKREKQPENIELDLRNESHGSNRSNKSEGEVEVQTPIMRIFG